MCEPVSGDRGDHTYYFTLLYYFFDFFRCVRCNRSNSQQKLFGYFTINIYILMTGTKISSNRPYTSGMAFECPSVMSI